jgi:hypothetical protein
MELTTTTVDDYDSNSCTGTVLVNCGGYLEFYYDANGQFDYRVVNGRRSLMEAEEMDAELANALPASSRGGAAVAGGPFSLEEGVKEEDGTSSGLRGGAKGSKK